jgi:glycosyltransferase involved in cell wall biosynthesis
MLHLLVPPGRSGLDGFSPKTAEFLSHAGVPTSLSLLWPEREYRFFECGHVPFGRRIFRAFLAPRYATAALRKVRKGDIAWILSFCVPLDKSPLTEMKLKNSSAKYIFHVVDDWFDFDFLREGTIARCRIADLVGTPTPQLAERVREFVPKAQVAVFEEPIDLDRLKQRQDSTSETPVILWCGNPYNLDHIEVVSNVLRKIRKKTPFTLRVICGEKPKHTYGLDVEWQQFNHAKECSLIAGSWFGIAPMPDTGHNRCKGAYKVKTYCASGLPVIASPVGFQADLIREGGNIGLLPETPEEWEQALLRLLTDRNLCLSMGRKARDYAERRFSYEAVAPRWALTLREHFGARVSGSHNATTERICQPCAG